MARSAPDAEDLEPGRVGALAALRLCGPGAIGLRDMTAVMQDLLAAAIGEHGATRRPAVARFSPDAGPGVAAAAADDPVAISHLAALPATTGFSSCDAFQ